MEVSTDAQSRMEAFLTSEEGEPEQEEDGVVEEQAEPEEELEDSQEETEETSEEEDSESDFETIEINGENVPIPKEIAGKVETLKRNLIADYTRKTQEAAEMRKQAQAFHEQNLQRIQFEKQNVDMLAKMQSAQERLKEYENVDWAALAEQDIAAYSKHKEIRDGLRQDIQELNNEVVRRHQFLQQQDEVAQQTSMKQTVEIIQRAVPDYFEKYDNKVVSVAENLAAKIGVTLDKAALKALSRDPVIVLGLVELAKYQDLLAKRPEISKKVAAAPKIGKSNQGKQRNQETQNVRKRLRETGRDEYAAKLIENLL